MEDDDAYLSPTEVIWSLLGSLPQPALPLSNQPTPQSPSLPKASPDNDAKLESPSSCRVFMRVDQIDYLPIQDV
jgi:hypothetical protein